MTRLDLFLLRVFKFLASLKLAIFVLTGIGVLSIVGTILEARYDADYAQKWIYHSPYMYFFMALLCVNLLNVMVDRWPWRIHHIGFVLAHIGIITLILGSYVTHVYGVDGQLILEQGRPQGAVLLKDSEVVIFSDRGGSGFFKVFSHPNYFLTHPPEKYPVIAALGDKTLKIQGYVNYAIRGEKMRPAERGEMSGPALRIQIQNKFINKTMWLSRFSNQPLREFDLGPARIVFADKEFPYRYKEGHVIVFRSGAEDESISYEIYKKGQEGSRTGTLGVGQVASTGWMDTQIRILRYFSRAQNDVEYTKVERPSAATTSVVRFEYDGKEYELGLNSEVRIGNSTSGFYTVIYRNQLVELGFDLGLIQFLVENYQGSRNPMSYQSWVRLPDGGKRKISMNQPLKYNGYTFYQASFQENEKGEATASILSVNRDPGRWVKYLGSFLIVLGTIIMFYFKRRQRKTRAVA